MFTCPAVAEKLTGSTATAPALTISKGPAFLGGNWTPDLSEITTFGDDIALVVVPATDAAVTLPATSVN
jgi:hypothetical protein